MRKARESDTALQDRWHCRTRLTAVWAVLPISLVLAACGPSNQQMGTEQQATLERYCLDCHNDVDLTADLSLAALDVSAVAADAETWEHVVRKLRTGMMPPHDGAPRPSEAQSAALAAWLETELDNAAATVPDPGRTVAFHRLNRSEYRNAVRDLLAVASSVAPSLR